MITPNIRKSFIAATVLAAFGLGALSPAHSLTVGAKWDPLYGPPFVGLNDSSTADDMWWSGSADVFISQSCLDGSGGGSLANKTIYATTGGCGGQGQLVLQNAVNELTIGDGGIPLQTLNFGALGKTVQVNSVKFNQFGQVEAIDTNFSEPFLQGTPYGFANGINLSNYYFSFGITAAGAQLYHLSKTYKHDSTGHDDAELFWKGVGNGHLGALCSPGSTTLSTTDCGFSTNLATMTFAPIAYVPEPSTSMLVFAALGLVGYARRRTQA